MTDDNTPSNPATSDDASDAKPLAKSAASVSSAAAKKPRKATTIEPAAGAKKPSSAAKTRSKAALKGEADTAPQSLDRESNSTPTVKKTVSKKPAASKPAAEPAAKAIVKKAASAKTAAEKTTAKTTASKSATQSASTKSVSTKSAATKSASAKPVSAKKAPAKKSLPKATNTAEPTPVKARLSVSPVPAPEAMSQPVMSAPVASERVMSRSSSTKSAGENASPKFDKEFLLDRAQVYWRLARMDKPIGALLLLWPTLWALWLAAEGFPRWDLLIIFVLGVFVMRAAGCVINDFADRKVDGRVKRTQGRPLATGEASSREAVGVFIALCLVAFGLVLLTDKFTIYLSLGGLLLAFCYPFMKRHTHLPQVVLGAAFAWGIPMAFAAQTGSVEPGSWLLYTTVVLWTVVYDTFYAMVDRDDDLRIGVKSTAVLFGEQDRVITAILQAITVYALVLVGSRFELGGFYYAGVTVAAALFVYQQYLIRFRGRTDCFRAFMNNNWVGAAIFVGIVLNYWL